MSPIKAHPCSNDERTTCILSDFLCDHQNDCPEGTDELPEICGYDENTEMCTSEEHWNPAKLTCDPVTHDHCNVMFFPCSQICSIKNSKLGFFLQ